MTDNVKSFKTATGALQDKVHAGGYKKGIAAVNLAAEFSARGINVRDMNQNEK